MAIEVVETQGKIPEGRYLITVDGIPQKCKKEGIPIFRKWKLIVLIKPGETRTVTVTLFPSQYKSILLACGVGKIQGESIEWDDEDVDGLSFYADIIYKERNGSFFMRVANAKSVKEEEDLP